MRDRWFYVYRIDRPRTGEYYIGMRTSHVWPTLDTSYFGGGKRVSRIPREELVKTILVIVQTHEEACRIESELITGQVLADPLCLNLAPGGGSMLGYEHSDEMREKVRQARLGTKMAPEQRARVSAAKTGVKKPLTPEGRAAVVAANKRRIWSEESRRKVSESLKRYNRS